MLNCEHLGDELLAFIGSKSLGLHHDQVGIIVLCGLAPVLIDGILE